MRVTRTAMMLVGVMSIGGLCLAADAAKPAAAKAPAAPAAAPTQEQMMAAWDKAKTPGPEHAILKNYEGKWTSHVTMTMDPAHPETSDGTSEGALTLGGRFVQVLHHGSFMGQPFEGSMLLGYDNLAKKYTSAWTDNMGTAIINYEGSYNAAKKALTMTGRFTDPMSGKPMRTRGVTTFVAADTMTYDEYMLMPDGKSMKTLHIDFKKM